VQHLVRYLQREQSIVNIYITGQECIEILGRLLTVIKFSKKGRIHTVTFANIDLLMPVLRREEEDEMFNADSRSIKFYESQIRKTNFFTLKREWLKSFPFVRLAIDKGNFSDYNIVDIRRNF
jgi:hypothetical protein